MDQILDVLQNNIIEIVTTITSTIISYIFIKLKAKYEDYTNHKIIQEVVNASVEYVEQYCKRTNSQKTSEQKFEMAKQKAVEWLTTKGIKVSDAELEILIESSVQKLNTKKTKENL